MTQKSRAKKSRRQHSKGQVNHAIDTILHPLFEQSDAFMVIDTVLHGLVEQNLKLSIRKFARYTFPKLLDKILDSH